MVDFYEGDEDPRDAAAYHRATTVCSIKPINRCLVQFVRFEPGDYHAVCGKPKEELCPVVEE